MFNMLREEKYIPLCSFASIVHATQSRVGVHVPSEMEEVQANSTIRPDVRKPVSCL